MTNQAATGIHDALFYSTDSELVRVAVPFLHAGLAADETAVLICDERKNALLSAALGHDDRIRVLTQHDVYQRPPAAIAAYTRLIEQQIAAGARRVRVVGELNFKDRPETWDEWLRYESVVNQAFATFPVWVMCGYDTRAVPAPVLARVEATHPNLLRAGSRAASQHYVEPAEYLRRSFPEVHDPIEIGAPAFQAEAVTEAGSLRSKLQTALAAGGHARRSIDAIVTAVNEVASNALIHGAPPVQVRVWSTSDRSLCTVTDHGAGFDDPFAGYLYDPDAARNGRGLWLTRQVCDTVQAHRLGDTFTVRLNIDH